MKNSLRQFLTTKMEHSGFPYKKRLAHHINLTYSYITASQPTAKDSEMITIDKIDELGALLAEIEALTSKAKAIKDAIKDEASLSGQRVWEGGKYEALFTATNVSTVDWKAVAKEMSIPVELIAKHTKTSARYTVNCEPKKTK